MEVYRLTRERFAKGLSGKGSSMMGARWNSVGVELIYTAPNRALAMATMPSDYHMLTIFVPDDIELSIVVVSDLLSGWNEFPYSSSSQSVGDKFAANNHSCLLKVPLAVVQGEHNILINPKHKDFSRIEIVETVKFPFDKRIFK